LADEINININDNTKTPKTIAKPASRGSAGTAGSQRMDAAIEKAFKKLESKLGKELVKALTPLLKSATKSEKTKKSENIATSLKPVMKKLAEDIVSGVSKQTPSTKSSKKADTVILAKAISDAIKSLETTLGKKLDPKTITAIKQKVGTKVSDVAGKDTIKVIGKLDKSANTIAKSVKELGNVIGSAKKIRKSGGGVDIKEIPILIRNLKKAGKEYNTITNELKSVKKSMSDLKGVSDELVKSLSEASKSVRSGVTKSYSGMKGRAQEDPVNFSKLFVKEINKAAKQHLPEKVAVKITPKLDKIENLADLEKQLSGVFKDVASLKEVKLDVKGVDKFLNALEKSSKRMGELKDVDIFGAKGEDLEKKLKKSHDIAKKIREQLDAAFSIKKEIPVKVKVDTKDVQKQITAAVEDASKNIVNKSLKGSATSTGKEINQLMKEFADIVKKQISIRELEIKGIKDPAVKERAVGDVKKFKSAYNERDFQKIRQSFKNIKTDAQLQTNIPAQDVLSKILSKLGSGTINELKDKFKQLSTGLGSLSDTVDTTTKDISSSTDIGSDLNEVGKSIKNLNTAIKDKTKEITDIKVSGAGGEKPPIKPAAVSSPTDPKDPFGQKQKPGRISDYAAARAPGRELRQYERSVIKPVRGGITLEPSKGIGADVIDKSKRRVSELSKSLDELQDFIIEQLEKGLSEKKYNNWEIIKKNYASKQESILKKQEFFKPSGGTTGKGGTKLPKEWKIQIADVGAMEKELGRKLQDNYGGSVAALTEAYKNKLIDDVVKSTRETPKQMSRLVGKWLKMSPTSEVRGAGKKLGMGAGTIDRLMKEKQKEMERGSQIVTKAFIEEIEGIFGEDLENVFKQTWADFDVSRKITGWRTSKTGKRQAPVVKSLAIPAAQISRTGGTTLETQTGSERSLSKFATYISGFEQMFKKIESQKGFKRGQYGDIPERIRQTGGISPRDLVRANELSKDLLLVHRKLGGPKAMEEIKGQYRTAATSRGVKLARAGVTTVPDFEKKINDVISSFEMAAKSGSAKPLTELIKVLDEVGVSAYDAVRALDKIEFENVYDIYKKVLKGGPGLKQPLRSVSESPAWDKPFRDFQKAVRQVEQLMPITRAERPRRGVHQENVVQTMLETSSIYADVKPRSPQAQKNVIKDLNIRLDELVAERRALESGDVRFRSQREGRVSRLPKDVRTLSSLGIPESPASSYVELRKKRKDVRDDVYSEGTEYLKTLGATTIKMYSDDLTELAPYAKQFTQAGRNIASVTNAMSSSAEELKNRFGKFGARVEGRGTEFPALRTQRETELIGSGRYGTKGYGFNVMAELRSTANTFEDQVVVSGKLANALTESVKTLIKPSEAGRIGGKGAIDKEGAVVTDIKAKILVDEGMVSSVMKKYQDILGFPEKYEGRADKALIDQVEKVLTVVRSSDVEVQTAKLAEVFLGHFGRKFTTRYGSKGVSTSPVPSFKVLPGEGLGKAVVPKSMGQLVAEILEKESPEAARTLKTKLIDSGNKFIIDLFTDASKGLAIPEEAKVQKGIFTQAQGALKGIVDLQQGTKGIAELKKQYGGIVGGQLVEEIPIDIRISAHGIGKRGLQPEILEMITSNLIRGGTGAQTTMRTELDESVYKTLLGGGKGSLSGYSKALGYKSTGIGREKISAMSEGFAKRAAELEEQSNYYSKVIDEFGKERTGLVGEKFVSIVEEPHETKEWRKSDIGKGAKGISLNIPAFSAYSTVFGKDSALMKGIRERASTVDAEQWEYIKTFLATSQSKSGEEYRKQLTKGLERKDITSITPFPMHAGTFDPSDERSLKGTMLDVEEFYKPFMLDLPKTGGFKEMGEREGFYVPGPLARGVYPESTVAGEYGPAVIPRRLQHIVNMAHQALEEVSEGQKLSEEITKQKAAFGAPDISDTEAKMVAEKVKEAEAAFEDWRTGRDKLTGFKLRSVFPVSLRREVESVISSGDMVKMSDMAERFSMVIQEFGASMSGTRPGFDKQTVEDMAKDLRLAMDLVIGPKNLEENLSKVQRGLELITAGESVETSTELAEIAKMPGLAGFTKAKQAEGLKGQLRAFQSVSIGKKAKGILPVLEQQDVYKKYDVAKTLGIAGKMGISAEERYAEELSKLEKAKIDYYHELAKVVMGKKGAIAESIFTRKIPSIMGKAVNAVVDKRKEFEVFNSRLTEIYSKYGDISGVGLESISDISKVMGEISKTHAGKISEYKAGGMPVLKERELGVPGALAKKLPVTFKKRFKTEKDVEGQLRAVPIKTTEVKGTLFDMLKYKQSIEKAVDFIDGNTKEILEKHIEEELVPYIESVRFPFTGISSLQPYKAKLLPEMLDPKTGVDLGEHALMVPGMPDLDFESFNKQSERIGEIIKKASEEREMLRGPEARDPGSEESQKASEQIARLTNLINDLNRALTDIIPKYIAVQQKLDFDGDTIQIHSDTVGAARRDIKKHYDDFGKDLNSISTTWAKKFTSEAFDPLTGESPLSDMLASFEKKFDPEKGFDFLKKPFLTRELEYLKPEKQLDILAGVSKKDMPSLLDELIKKGVRGTALVGKTGMTGPGVETSADVVSKIINAVKKPEGEGDYAAALLKSLQDFDAKFSTQVYDLVKEELRESVFSSKFKDAIEAQLFKLHTGTDVEALNRIQALVESKIGFGKEGMLSGTAGQEFKDVHAMINELYRFGTQKGMDVKHAGELPVAGEIVKMLSKGEIDKLWKGIQSDEGYKQLKDFTDTIGETIRARAGEQTTPQLRKTLEEAYMKAGKPVTGIPEGRKAMIEDLIDLKGFKGFLESIFNQIKEEALKGLMTVEGYTKEQATGELQKLLTTTRDKEAAGININRYITQPQRPLYGFRTASATPRSKMYEYEKRHGKLDVPEFAYSGFASKKKGQEKSFVASYKEAEATAASLREALMLLGKDEGKGAYSEMIRSTIDNLYKDQAIIEAILSQTKLGESPQKTLTQGLQVAGMKEPVRYDLSAFTKKSPLSPDDLSNLESVMKELSRLAGIPSLTREEKKAVRIREEEMGVGKQAQAVIAKKAGVSVGEFDTELQERAETYKDLLIRKAEAQKQFEKAMSSLEAKAGEGRALMGLIPKAGGARTITRDYEKFRGLIPEAGERAGIGRRKPFPSGGVEMQPPPRGPAPPAGGFRKPPKEGEVYKVYIVGADPGVFSGGISESVYTGRKARDQETAARAIKDLEREDPLGAFGAKQEDVLKGMKFSPGGGGGYAEYIKAQPAAAGMGTDAAFANLKRLHSLAKDFQRQLGISKEATLKGMPKQYGDITKDIERAEAGDITGKEFYETIDRLKKEEGLSFRDSVKAWKLYRIAIGDFLLNQAEEAKRSMEEADVGGRTDEAAEQYKIYNDTVNRLKKLIEGTAGKKSDIYTFDKQWISPEVAYAAGVYKTPEQIAKQTSKPLGEDEKLKELYDKIIKDFTSGKQPTAPVEKARDVFRSLSAMDDELINLLVDAEQFKRVGSEINDAWDLDSLINDVSKLRAALDMFAKQNLAEEMDVTARKNLEETIKYLKNIENMYASIANKRDVKPSWGETGVVKVPKWESPEKQLAMHRRNTAKIEEYMRRPAAEGGAKIGERQTYSMKVFGEAGEVIKNSIVNFHKYGEGVNAAGQKVGQMSKRVEDLTKKMQVGTRSFRAALKRVVMWGGAATIVYGGVSKLKDSIGLIGEVETKIAELKMVMSSPDTSSFEKLQSSAVGFAKQYGVPVTEILRSMKIFAQQGLKQEEVIDRTQTATLASNVTTLSAADATEALTAAMKVYRQEGESSVKFLDAWSEVEAKHAITAGDMADALKKAASAAKNAGVDFNELNGIVAAIGSVTRQSGKEVGTSLRFIFRRLSSEKGPTELGKIGIPVVDNKELRSGFDILGDLSMKWDELTSSQKMNVAQAIGGTRQYNSLLVLMDNWDEALSAIKDSTNSKGSAERRNLELMKTYEKQLQQTAESANKLKIEFGKVYLPIAKFSLKGLRTFMEIASNIPTTVKAASVAVGLLFTYLAKGSDIIDNLVNRFRSGRSVIGEFASAVSSDIKVGMYESFGKGDESDPLLKNLNKIGKEGGTSLDKFHSSLGKSMFMLTKWGRDYNKFLEGMGAGAVGGAAGTVLEKGVGKPLENFGKALSTITKPAQGFVFANDIFAAEAGPLAFLDDLLLMSAQAGGKGSEAVGKAMQKIGNTMGKEAQNFAENWTSSNAGIVKSTAPLLTTLVGLSMAGKKLYNTYGGLTKTAGGYEKSMYNVKRADEAELKNIRDLSGSYDRLDNRLSKINKSRSNQVKSRQQELGTYKSPINEMASLQKDTVDLSNQIADSNINLIAGYDKLGNAILKTSGSFKTYLSELEKIKVKDIAKTDVKVLEKYIYDLTETAGAEKFKNELKELAEEVPLLGEMISKGIKVSPAKALDVGVTQINKLISKKGKYPLTTAFDEDISKLQGKLRGLSDAYKATYGDFKRVLSEISTEGLSGKEITDLFNTEALRKGFELMVEIEPTFQLAKDIKWEDVMGAEVMKRVAPELASSFAATAELTKANLETMGVKPRVGKVRSGDIATFMKEESDDFNMAGQQARITLKKGIDDTYEWVATYFNTKTLEIEERTFGDDLQNMVDQIFPLTAMKEDLSERMDSLNEFVAGASAGLRGITPKDFKRDLNLGERFFSDIATTTILQGSKGFTPGPGGGGFGQSPFQQDWGKSFKEFYAKPSKEYRMQLEQLQKMRLEGLEGGKVTLATGIYEELSKLQDILKNNQVVLQYRAAFVDLTKTLEQGARTVKENVAIEMSRQDVEKNIGGYMSGITTGLESIDLGINKFADITPRQRSLIESPEQRRTAKSFLVNQIKASGIKESISAVDRTLVAIDSITKVSKGFGAAMSPEDLKKYTETVAKTGDVGVAELKLETSKVVDNTAATVDRLDQLLENQGDPDALERMLSNWTDYISSGFTTAGKTVQGLERVAGIREKAEETGDQKVMAASNKVLDQLSKGLVDQVGFKKASRLIGRNEKLSPFGADFKPEEFQQRVFQGLNLDTFLDKMTKQEGFGKGFFKNSEKDIEKLRKLQEVDGKNTAISSKELLKLQAAFGVFNAFQKKGSSDVITKLNSQIEVLEESIKEKREKGAPVAKLSKELGVVKLAKKQEQTRLDLHKTAQAITLSSTAAMGFAKAMGFSEKQIKALGLGAVTTYGALKIASKAVGTEMPESGKKFGAALEEAAKKKMAGEDIGKIDKIKIKSYGKKFMKEYSEGVKETLGTSAEELKEKYGKSKEAFEKRTGAQGLRGAARDTDIAKAAVAAMVAYTATGYIAKKGDEETRVATLESRAKEQQEIISRIILENPKQAQEVIDSMISDAKKVSEAITVPTEEKSLVLDTDKEREVIIGNLKKIREERKKEYEKIAEEQRQLAIKAGKEEIIFKVKAEVEGMDRVIDEVEELAELQDKIVKKQDPRSTLSKMTGAISDYSKEFVKSITSLFTYAFDLKSILPDFLSKGLFDDPSKIKAFGMMAGKYKPQTVDYGIQDVRGMTPEEFASFSSRSVEKTFKKFEVADKQRVLKEEQVQDVSKRISQLETVGRTTGLSEVEKFELDKLKEVLDDLETEFDDLMDVVTETKITLKSSIDEAKDSLRDFSQVMDALGRFEESDLERTFGQRQVLNKSLVGFSGDAELPRTWQEFSPQEYAYTNLIKPQETFISKFIPSMFKDTRGAGFQKATASYTDALKETDAMRARIQGLLEERRAAITNSERWNELTSQITTATGALGSMVEGIREFGETANIVFKLSEAIQNFNRSMMEVSISQQAEDLPGMKEFRDTMSKLPGGSHPAARQWVEPYEQAKAAEAGAYLGPQATAQEIERAGLLRSLQQNPADRESRMRLSYLPQKYSQQEKRYEQQQAESALIAQQQPYIEAQKRLEELKFTPGTTDADIKEIEKLQGALTSLLTKSVTTPGVENLIASTKQAKWAGTISGEEAAEEIKRIKQAGPSQFAGFSLGDTKEFTTAMKELMTDIGDRATQIEQTAMTEALSPVNTELQKQTALLQKIAEDEFKLGDGLAGVFEKIPLEVDGQVFTRTNKANGGRIFGEGGPREDKVPAYLSPGEFVIRSSAAQRIGYDNLSTMNSKGAIPAFAEGGGVFRRTADYMEASTESMKKERKDLVSGYLKTGKMGISKQLELATTETIGSIIKYGAEFGDLVTSGAQTTSKVLKQVGKEGTPTGLFDMEGAVQGWKKAIGFAKVLGSIGYSETAKTLNQVAKEGSATGLFDITGAKEGYAKFFASEAGQKAKEAATYNIPEATGMLISSIAGEGAIGKLAAGGKKLTQLKALNMLDKPTNISSVLDDRINDFVYERLLVKSDIIGKEKYADKFLKLQKSGKFKDVQKPNEAQLKKALEKIKQRQNKEKFIDKVKEIKASSKDIEATIGGETLEATMPVGTVRKKSNLKDIWKIKDPLGVVKPGETLGSISDDLMSDINMAITTTEAPKLPKMGTSDYEYFMYSVGGVSKDIRKQAKQLLKSKPSKSDLPQPKRMESWESFVKRQEQYFKNLEIAKLEKSRKLRKERGLDDLMLKEDLYDPKHLSISPEKQLENFEKFHGKEKGLLKLREHLDDVASGQSLAVEGTPGFSDRVVFHRGSIVQDFPKEPGMADWYDLKINETMERAEKVNKMVNNLSRLKKLKKADGGIIQGFANGGYVGNKFRRRDLLEKKKKYMSDRPEAHGHQFNIKKSKENQERLMREFGYSASYMIDSQASDESYYRFTETPEDKPTEGWKRPYTLAGYSDTAGKKIPPSKEDEEFANFVDRITAIEDEAKKKGGRGAVGRDRDGIYSPRREIRSAQWKLGRENKLFEGQKGLDIDYDTWITQQGLSTAAAEYGSGYPGAPGVDETVRATRSEIFERKKKETEQIAKAQIVLKKAEEKKKARFFTDAYGDIREVTGEQYASTLGRRKLDRFFTDETGSMSKVSGEQYGDLIESRKSQRFFTDGGIDGVGKTDLEKTLALYKEGAVKNKQAAIKQKQDDKISDLFDLKVKQPEKSDAIPFGQFAPGKDRLWKTSFPSDIGDGIDPVVAKALERDTAVAGLFSPEHKFVSLGKDFLDDDKLSMASKKAIQSPFLEDKMARSEKERVTFQALGKDLANFYKLTKDTFTRGPEEMIKDLTLGLDPNAKKKILGRSFGAVAGAAESAVSLATGLGATVAGGYLGTLKGLTSGDVDSASKTVLGMQEKFTYSPRTKSGQGIMGFVSKPFEMLAGLGEIAGTKVGDITGSHFLGSTTQTAVEALPLLLPLKGLKGKRGLKGGQMPKPKSGLFKKFSNYKDFFNKATTPKGLLDIGKGLATGGYSKLLQLFRTKKQIPIMERALGKLPKRPGLFKTAVKDIGKGSLKAAGTPSLLGVAAKRATQEEKISGVAKKQKEIQSIKGDIDRVLSNSAIVDRDWNADTLMALEDSIHSDLFSHTSELLKTGGYGEVGMGTNLYRTDEYGKRVGNVGKWMELQKKSFMEGQDIRKVSGTYKKVLGSSVGDVPKNISKLIPGKPKIPSSMIMHTGPKYAKDSDRLKQVKEQLEFINSSKGKSMMTQLMIVSDPSSKGYKESMLSNFGALKNADSEELLKERLKINSMYSMLIQRRDRDKLKEAFERFQRKDARYEEDNNQSMSVYHNGGQVRKTGPIFAQKGELIVPKLADGSTGINAVVSSDTPANKSVNTSIKLDLTELKSLLDEGISLETDTVKLESDVVRLPEGTTVDAVLAGDATVRVADGETVEAVLPSDATVKAVLDPDAVVSVDTNATVTAVLANDTVVGLDPNAVVSVDPNATVTAVVDTSKIELTTTSVTLDATEAVNAITNALSDITVNVSGGADVGAASAKINTAVDNMLSLIGNLEERQGNVDSEIQMLNEKTEQTSDVVSDLSSKIYDSVGSLKTEIYDTVSTKIEGLRSSLFGLKDSYDNTINELNIRISMALNSVGVNNLR
jgi:TP901 family phage tail tape measure protein